MVTRPEERWHLDKKVPIGIIVAILVQSAMGVWYVSKLDSRIYALEVGKTDQHERDERQDKTTVESMTLLQRQLERIDEKLDRIIEKHTNTRH
jgi:hypothetical protein